MAQPTLLFAQHELVAVSSPGIGLARQYRVQYQTESSSLWQMYASFANLEQAQACIDSIQQRGCRARLVHYTICPAAA